MLVLGWAHLSEEWDSKAWPGQGQHDTNLWCDLGQKFTDPLCATSSDLLCPPRLQHHSGSYGRVKAWGHGGGTTIRGREEIEAYLTNICRELLMPVAPALGRKMN